MGRESPPGFSPPTPYSPFLTRCNTPIQWCPPKPWGPALPTLSPHALGCWVAGCHLAWGLWYITPGLSYLPALASVS